MLSQSTNSRIAQIVDFFTAILGYSLAFVAWAFLSVSFPYKLPTYSGFEFRYHIILSVLIAFITVNLFQFYKAYSYQRFTSYLSEVLIVLKVELILFTLIVLGTFVSKDDVNRTIVVLLFLTNGALFSVQKYVLFKLAAYIRKKGRDRKRVLIIGSGTRARAFLDAINKQPGWGLDVVGILSGDKEKVGNEVFGHKVIGIFDDIVNVLKTINPEEVIITVSTKRFDQIRTILEVCEQEGVQVRLYSDFFGKLTKRVRVENIYGLDIISFTTIRHSEFGLLGKRIIDIGGSLFAILLLSPFMIIAALGIWIADGRPVIYNWNVIGLNKKPFSSWKFRTMVKNADELKSLLMDKNEMEGPVFKIKNDPRVFPFGRWLRKWSIDETPQLFSVLLGDMSLVGPRPAGNNEIQGYESWHRRRLSVKPGITCIWQASGRNGINRFEDWVNLDLKYIDNWSIWLDIKILFMTIPAVLRGKGAS